MSSVELKCIICGNEKAETVFVRLIAKGVEGVACGGCMPIIIHGPKGHRH